MIFAVDHPLCDVGKQKTQSLIAHQKEVIDRTKKSFLAALGLIGAQVFGKAKKYKPTWTQNHPSAVGRRMVLCPALEKIVEVRNPR